MLEQQEITKRDAFEEISKTLLYLLREGEIGDEGIDISNLLNNKLEKDILSNFEGRISKNEYEELIFRIFKAKDVKIGEFHLADIDAELKELQINQNIKGKKLINEKIKIKFNIPEEQEKNIRKYILFQYKDIASDYLRVIIHKKISEGMDDEEELLKVGKKEKFKINVEDIKNIVNTQLRKYQESIVKSDRLAQKFRKVTTKKPRIGTAIKRKQLTSKEKKAEPDLQNAIKQRQIKTITDRFTKMKARFIEKYCRIPKFNLIENFTLEDKRHLTHRSVYGGREIFVKTITDQQDVENVIVEFKRMIMGKKVTEILDINDIKKLIESPKGFAIFTNKLKLISSVLNFSNFQESIWFLGGFMTEYNNIPKKSAKFIKENFKDYVENIDKSLLTHTIKKSLK